MKSITKHMIMLIIMLSGILMLIYGYSYAKYTSNSIWNYYLSSKGFYLSSDTLGDNIKNVNSLWDGTSVHFDLKNSQNDSLVTEYDITYEVKCEIEGDNSTDTSCYLNGTESNTLTGTLSSYEGCINYKSDQVDVKGYDQITCETSGYNWEVSPAIADLYFDIVSTNKELTDVTANITVNTTYPYDKSLTGKFILHKIIDDTGKLNTSYNTFTTYDRLTLSNSSISNKCANISWNADNIHISTDKDNLLNYKVDSNGYINEFEVKLASEENISYIFYKVDNTQNYSIDDFVITEMTSCP